MPWRRITKFANEIAGTIAKRFPPEEFLKALDVVVPEEWVKAHDPSFTVSNLPVYLTLMQRMEARSPLPSKAQSIGEAISNPSSCGHYS